MRKRSTWWAADKKERQMSEEQFCDCPGERFVEPGPGGVPVCKACGLPLGQLGLGPSISMGQSIPWQNEEDDPYKVATWRGNYSNYVRCVAEDIPLAMVESTPLDHLLNKLNLNRADFDADVEGRKRGDRQNHPRAFGDWPKQTWPDNRIGDN
jgi:hypothetical protein